MNVRGNTDIIFYDNNTDDNENRAPLKTVGGDDPSCIEAGRHIVQCVRELPAVTGKSVWWTFIDQW